MYRMRDGQPQVFLAHPGGPFFQNKDAGHWSIPKGEIETGEDLFAAAIREFKEETGIGPRGDFIELGSVRQTGGKIVHAVQEFAEHAPPEIPVLPAWSPVKVFGGYGAPVEIAKAARAGVPLAHRHHAACHQHGCNHALHQLFAAADAARNRYAGFFGLGCDCFAF